MTMPFLDLFVDDAAAEFDGLLDDDVFVFAVFARPFGFFDFACIFPFTELLSIAAGDFGTSRTTCFAGLSSRRPRNEGCRNRPSLVHSVNSTSQTSSGFTHV